MPIRLGILPSTLILQSLVNAKAVWPGFASGLLLSQTPATQLLFGCPGHAFAYDYPITSYTHTQAVFFHLGIVKGL